MKKAGEYNFDQSKLEIGQIIYILSAKETKIVPVQVCEMVNVQTLKGNSTSWKVAFGSEEKRKIFDLDKVNGKKFLSLQNALDYIRFEFEQFLTIEKSRVEEKVSSWFEVVEDKPKTEQPVKEKDIQFDPFEDLDDEPIITVEPVKDPNKEEVILDNGSRAKLVMTDELKELMK